MVRGVVVVSGGQQCRMRFRLRVIEHDSIPYANERLRPGTPDEEARRGLCGEAVVSVAGAGRYTCSSAW
jgi:hypothetical protein